MLKCTLTKGRDVHLYVTRGRGNYRSRRHRTVVYERLPSQAGVHHINSLPTMAAMTLLSAPWLAHHMVLSPVLGQVIALLLCNTSLPY
ncbi:hypothetical protein J6590_074123 [Homalodisca vitripennis]|nr:hypothetical protein J6590_074123 [Homalodisca vitripennis]